LYLESRNNYRDGNFGAALLLLQQSAELSKDPRLLWNMAACEAKLGHHAAALTLVERYRSAVNTLLSDEERKEIDAFVAAALAFVGRVRIESSEVGIRVQIDGVLAGTTPFARPLYVDQGTRRVRFERVAFQSVERSEQVPGGSELTWTIELEPIHQTLPVPAPKRNWGALGLGIGGAALFVAGVASVAVAADKFNNFSSACAPLCDPSETQPYRSLEIAGAVLLSVGVATSAAALGWGLAKGPKKVSTFAVSRRP
jgi:hypothetical protein